MASPRRVGRCPGCGTVITEAWVLIEYETDTGRRTYAECPGCGSIAHPVPE